jgi:hypothetical protein
MRIYFAARGYGNGWVGQGDFLPHVLLRLFLYCQWVGM